MGIVKADDSRAFTLNYILYNLTDGAVVEEVSQTSWNFFSGSDPTVGNMARDLLSGSIVLYGKFSTETTIDKLWGVYKNTSANAILEGLKGDKTYTVTFNDANGNELTTVENLTFGATVSYDGAMPTPNVAEDALFTYSYAWDKELEPVYSDAVYTLKLVATAKSGYKSSGVTAQGDGIVFSAGNIGAGADYKKGQNAGGTIAQSYFAYDGEYSYDDYIVFDFTGKNMPEIMFFAKNYDTSMYYSEGKQGVVVASGITLWNGTIGSAQGNNTMVGVSGPFGAYFEGAAAPHGGNMLSDFNAKLARANLVDGTQYRIIMGITKASPSAFTLNYVLYNVTDGAVVEEVSQTSWNFFTGENVAVNNLTLDALSGSIVLYGKFNTTCTIDKLYGVESGTFAEVVEKYTA